MLTLDLDLLADGFTVSNPGCIQCAVNVIDALELADDDFKLHVAET